MSAPPRVIYIDKFSVVDCLKDIGGDWEYILKSDYDELQAKLKSTERELAKWKEPFDQEKFDAAAKQASHKDSLAAMCVYQTALEHALKHHQAKLTETERLNKVALEAMKEAQRVSHKVVGLKLKVLNNAIKELEALK